MGVLSAIEMACWDIVGKELDRPIYDLLGGRVRERIRSYTYLYPKEGDIAMSIQPLILQLRGQLNMLLVGLLQSRSIR